MNWPILIGFVIAALIAAGASYFLVFKDAPLLVRVPPSLISGSTYLYLGIVLSTG